MLKRGSVVLRFLPSPLVSPNVKIISRLGFCLVPRSLSQRKSHLRRAVYAYRCCFVVFQSRKCAFGKAVLLSFSVLNHLQRPRVGKILPVLTTDCASSRSSISFPHTSRCLPAHHPFVTDKLSGCTKFTYTLLQLILLYYDCRVYFCIYICIRW